VWDNETPNRIFDNYIWQSELQPLKDISYKKSNRVLILGFVERWQTETNTFHMMFGEMTITFILVGILVMGQSVDTPRGLPCEGDAC